MREGVLRRVFLASDFSLPPISAAFSQQGPAKPVRATTPCTVTKLSDGDSFACAGLGRVRMLGIDAPELSQKPFGNRSRDALLALMPIGSTVQLEQDVQARDRNGRLLAYVWRNGRMVNWEMVRGGWVVTLTYAPNVQYVDQLRAAAKAAEKDSAGLWAVDGFACLPFDQEAWAMLELRTAGKREQGTGGAMFEQLSTFDKFSVIAWAAMIVFFAPRIYKSWRGQRQDWIEVGWLVGGAAMIAVTLIKPEWRSDASTFIVFPLLILTLLDRRSRKE